MRSHGIMFHHFYGNGHPKVQGAISQSDFEKIIKLHVNNGGGQGSIILNANEYFDKALKDNLKENEICITFDDCLKCQYDVAKPILDKYQIKAFWFIYTSHFEGKLERLEVLRHFRTTVFSDIEDFYRVFFAKIKQSFENASDVIRDFNPKHFLEDFPFYTDNDRLFRYLRDKYLSEDKYFEIMSQLMDEYNYNPKNNVKNLWINEEEVKILHDEGHFIGLHSHTHPTMLSTSTYEEQKFEYTRNKHSIEKIIGTKVTCVSYPCNSYNEDTLKIMKNGRDSLGIQIGFRANMKEGYNSILEIPREDCANILAELERQKL